MVSSRGKSNHKDYNTVLQFVLQLKLLLKGENTVVLLFCSLVPVRTQSVLCYAF